MRIICLRVYICELYCNLRGVKEEIRMMAQVQIYEGTPEQLVKQLSKLPGTRKYKITVTPDEPTTTTTSKLITFGMFPQFQSLTEEDFKGAEWQEDSEF